jgi:hypothetical protein
MIIIIVVDGGAGGAYSARQSSRPIVERMLNSPPREETDGFIAR